MIVFLRPKRSASFETASAPKKEPAGMAATRAPWGLEDGCNGGTLVSLCARLSVVESILRCERYGGTLHSARTMFSDGSYSCWRSHVRSVPRTWMKCPNRRVRPRYMRKNQPHTMVRDQPRIMICCLASTKNLQGSRQFVRYTVTVQAVVNGLNYLMGRTPEDILV